MTIHKSQVVAAGSIILSWLLIGTVLFHALENWTWIQAFYFSTVSLTTVGYGDLHPTTDLTRLIASFYILIGVVSVVSAISVLGGLRMAKRATKLEDKRKK
jgi:voltage-gated potassium channel